MSKVCGRNNCTKYFNGYMCDKAGLEEYNKFTPTEDEEE